MYSLIYIRDVLKDVEFLMNVHNTLLKKKKKK